MIVFMIVLISCSVHDNEDGKTNGNFGVIKKISLILEYGRDSVERPILVTSRSASLIITSSDEFQLGYSVTNNHTSHGLSNKSSGAANTATLEAVLFHRESLLEIFSFQIVISVSVF